MRINSQRVGHCDVNLPDDMEKPLPRPPRVQSFVHQATWMIDTVQGYHFGVIWCAVASGTVCLVNIILIVWGIRQFEVIGGLGTIQEGSCQNTKNLATYLHLVINVLSTMLLGASNYTMQCLSSPTRKEIDKAHSRNTWMDIGVPSIRNLARISLSRRLMWWMLALTSIPLHLMWNSAVFTTLSAQAYSVFVVTPGFLDGGQYTIPNQYSANAFEVASYNASQTVLDKLRDTKNELQTLGNSECIQAYARSYVSKHASVLLVSADTNENDSVLVWYGTRRIDGLGAAQDWICNINATNGSVYAHDGSFVSCDISKDIKDPRDWRNGGYKIDYCLSEPVDEKCKIQFSTAIMIVVICCNFVKFVVMGHLAWRSPKAPLVTLGDAVASFLDRPDPATTNACLLGEDYFRKNVDWVGRKELWRQTKCHWFRGASKRKWIWSHVL